MRNSSFRWFVCGKMAWQIEEEICALLSTEFPSLRYKPDIPAGVSRWRLVCLLFLNNLISSGLFLVRTCQTFEFFDQSVGKSGFDFTLQDWLRSSCTITPRDCWRAWKGLWDHKRSIVHIYPYPQVGAFHWKSEIQSPRMKDEEESRKLLMQ